MFTKITNQNFSKNQLLEMASKIFLEQWNKILNFKYFENIIIINQLHIYKKKILLIL